MYSLLFMVLTTPTIPARAPAPLPKTLPAPIRAVEVPGEFIVGHVDMSYRFICYPDHTSYCYLPPYTYVGIWRLDGNVLRVTEWIDHPMYDPSVDCRWHITLRREWGRVCRSGYNVVFDPK